MSLRNLAVAALFLLVIGIATQIPLPGGKTAPAAAVPVPPALQSGSVAPAPPGTQAESDNAVSANPTRHAMLQEVVDAAEQVEAFPCSAKSRHRLAEAVAVLGNFDRDHGGEPPTVTQVDGHAVPIGDPLGGDAHDITTDAMMGGVVHRTISGVYEVPDPYAPVAAKPYLSDRGARFMCENPG